MNFAKAHRLHPPMTLAVVLATASLAATESAVLPKTRPGVDWVLPGLNTNLLVWGIRGGLLWGLPPAAGQPTDGPRGLIRLRYPVLTNGGYDLLNFIAIEPIVHGHRGFSELEPSRLDGVPGKRLWILDTEHDRESVTHFQAGRQTRLDTGAERLTVEVAVERFDNGAHVRLTLSQASDAPDELELVVHSESDSARIEYCVLSATMGNKARARQLWLKAGPVSSLDLYKDYKESGFAPHQVFPLPGQAHLDTQCLGVGETEIRKHIAAALLYYHRVASFRAELFLHVCLQPNRVIRGCCGDYAVKGIGLRGTQPIRRSPRCAPRGSQSPR
jgi:hypothetical protein